MSDIRIGTSAFTAAGRSGTFYPKRLKPADYLSYYAQHFDTVEVDSTFYATPNVNVVRSWDAKTPQGFLFAAKVPQEITHEKVLKDCDAEFKAFLTTMETLGEKLGPLLLQFGKFDKYAFKSLDDFLARLIPFLKTFRRSVSLPSRFAIRTGWFLNSRMCCASTASLSR